MIRLKRVTGGYQFEFQRDWWRVMKAKDPLPGHRHAQPWNIMRNGVYVDRSDTLSAARQCIAGYYTARGHRW